MLDNDDEYGEIEGNNNKKTLYEINALHQTIDKLKWYKSKLLSPIQLNTHIIAGHYHSFDHHAGHHRRYCQ